MKIDNKILDIDGRELKIGHIVAVRYSYNSYVGVIRFRGLHLCEGAQRFQGASQYHPLEPSNTYQILGHLDIAHKDFNAAVYNWHKSEACDCPVKIRVYDNMLKIN